MPSRPSDSTVHRSKRALTKRKTTAQTAWLDGHILWHEGCVVWKHGRERLRPSAADLSHAHRCLHKSRGALQPESLLGELDEVEAWLQARCERLEVAKRLSSLSAPDLPALAGSSRARNPAAIQRLVDLLLAEALCLNELIVRPSSVLLRHAVLAPGLAPDALRWLLRDELAPSAGRALAAMTLGALWKAQDAGVHVAPQVLIPAESSRHAWMRRAYEWGWRRGLPDEPALTVALLEHENGVRSAGRCSLALSRFRLVDFPAQLVRELLADGVQPAQVLEIAESASSLESIAAQMVQFYRVLLEQARLHPVQRRAGQEAGPNVARKRSKEAREQQKHEQQRLEEQALSQSRQETLALLSKMLHRVIRATRDASTVQRWVSTLSFFLQPLFKTAPDLWPYLTRGKRPDTSPIQELALLVEASLRPSKAAIRLPAVLQRGYLNILALCQGGRWDEAQIFSAPTPGSKVFSLPGQLRQWQEKVWHADIKPLRALLLNCGSATIVRQALEMDVHSDLSHQEWRDPEMYGLALSVARAFASESENWRLWHLWRTLHLFPTAREARAALSPVIEALQDASSPVRAQLLFDFMDAVGGSRQAMRLVWPRLFPYLALLRRFAEKTQELERCSFCVEASVQVERVLWRRQQIAAGEVPSTAASEWTDDERSKAHLDSYEAALLHQDQVRLWLGWMIDHLLESEGSKKSPIKYLSLGAMTRLSCVLADGDLEAFQSIFAAVARYKSEHDAGYLDKGLQALTSYPDLRGALSYLVARQPGRCISLLVRLGLASRLGPDLLAPLDVLQEHVAEEQGEAAFTNATPEDAVWRELLTLAPELAEAAARYRRARRLLGQISEVPSGVRQALRGPDKVAAELRHLEQKLQEQPSRADWAARVASLRGQILNQSRLRRLAREQAAERLAQASAEACLTLGEQQVLACYRARLTQVAGVLPPGVAFDDNWLNATLLTMDIESNRRLLRRLLRAEIAGQKSWREEQPANALFLHTLAYSGADAQAWLRVRPRLYRCDGVSGGKVRLHLERDPLHILQMGNYFDTCLSFGNCNAFSTVANACELNKRVVYATDGAGRVVGRKLIGINNAGEMVGFHTYTSLSDDEANQALRAIFGRYGRDFASSCRLRLAESGEVATLLAEDWYDDGIVSWDDTEPQKAKPAVIARAPSLSV